MTYVSLSAQHITKHYGGVTALADGNLEIQSGEVVALIGANGSGKSTLGKIITGVVAPDGGPQHLNNQSAFFSSPQDARKHGIVAVYQELSLIQKMTVAENIWLAHEPTRTFGFVRSRSIRERTEELLSLFANTFRSPIHADDIVSALSPDEKQIIEILKALSLEPDVIILDEATASLDNRQVNCLFEMTKEWKAKGKAIVFVSHRLDEVFRVADRVSILRSGKTVFVSKIGEMTHQELVRHMVEGITTISQLNPQSTQTSTVEVLRAENLKSQMLRGVSFSVHSGEILGLGGLSGQGQSEVLLALFGAIPFKGKVTLDGHEVVFNNPRQAMKAQLAFVPGDRNKEGLLSIRSILENLMLPSWRKYGGVIRMEHARADATDISKNGLKLVMGSLDDPVSSLSGGNAQKVVLGKWLLRHPKILLLDDPTKGVDVGAKAEFYRILLEMKAAGTAILFYSTDDEELTGLCDRVVVLTEGHISAELHGDRLTLSELITASMGSGSSVGEG
jgi:ribose transport system ATP-binding protein